MYIYYFNYTRWLNDLATVKSLDDEMLKTLVIFKHVLKFRIALLTNIVIMSAHYKQLLCNDVNDHGYKYNNNNNSKHGGKMFSICAIRLWKICNKYYN